MIEILIGMIGSGKTTYAKTRARQGALVLSHDDITQALHCEYRYEQSLKHVYLNMLTDMAKHAVRANRDLIIDRTNLTREARSHWLDFAWHEKIPAIAVVFPIREPAIHATRRFQSDSRGRSYEDWLKVAEHHYAQAQAEPLNWVGEGFGRLKSFQDGFKGFRMEVSPE